MDKHKMITIKINGKDRPHKDVERKKEVKVIKEDNQDKGAQVVPKTKIRAWNETAAAKEPVEDSFDWILPETVKDTEVTGNKSVLKPKPAKQRGLRLPGLPTNTKKSRKHSPIIPGVALNIFLAVAVGLGFGMIILNIVKSDQVQTAEQSVTPPAEEKDQHATAGTQVAELPAISTFVVQGGVFSTKDSADTAAKGLGGQGIFAAAVPVDGKFALLLATAGSIEEAKAAGDELESKGAEVFAKPLELAGFSVAGLTTEESSVLKLAPELFANLSSGNGNADTISAQLNQLKEIDEKKINNKEVLSAKKSLESAATAFQSSDKTTLEKANLAFLAAWQSLGK
ncbi:stage II sporulation protein B [Mesobacillus persicus]|uniref:Stage II sporulation protein B n=1 Tax=Mesobacillus persicus TaxID=930146 RepID=A0A1H7XH83_9BACI|nr:SPOR domain-containing protein [Mesobacillus persicus]SEM33101.1 stage II sporulation protein B [Mesobacillus persicus]